MVSTSRRSSWYAPIKRISSQQRIWCRDVLTPSNFSAFTTTSQVNFLQFLSLIVTLPLHSVQSTATSFDLSTAAKLRHLAVLCTRPGVRWVTEALGTVKSKNLQRITICLATDTMSTIPEPVRRQWHDLDRLLVQFWTSHSIRPKVSYEVVMGGDMKDYAPRLLPELTRRGLVDLTEETH